jgi:UDP-N-acetylmuramate dehydrogenase
VATQIGEERAVASTIGRPFGDAVQRGVPLAGLTSVGFGGPAQYLARPASADEVQELLAEARRLAMPVRVMGGGTNLFVDDAGVTGLVLVIGSGAMNAVRVDGPRVMAGAGVALRRLVNAAVEHGLAGLEPLVGIPGSVGGALRMNAGSREGDIAAVTAAVTAIDRDGQPVRLSQHQCAFAYRRSALADQVIVEAEFDLTPGDRGDLKRRARNLWRRRQATQPLGLPSAGCVFRNPPGRSAGWLIDQAGLKGTRIGGMEISREHANFFVNRGGGTFDNARGLIDRVRDAVRGAFGVELQLEVELWQDRGPQAGTLY